LHLDLLIRIPKIFLISGGIYFLLQIIGLLLVYEETAKKEDEDNLNENGSLSNSDHLITNSHQEDVTDQIEVNSLGVKYEMPEEGLTIKQALSVKEFYLGTLLLALFTIAPSLIVSYYKTFGQTFINDDKYLAIIGSVSSIFNACGRLFWGFLIDRMPFKYCYLILNTIITALIITVYLNTYIIIKEIFLIWISAIFFLQCGIFVITPTTMAKCFGQKHFTSIYGLMYMMCIPSSFVAALLGPYSDKIGWFWLFFSGCCFSFIGKLFFYSTYLAVIIYILYSLFEGWITVLFFNVKKSNGKYI
jgi:MFS family permease